MQLVFGITKFPFILAPLFGYFQDTVIIRSIMLKPFLIFCLSVCVMQSFILYSYVLKASVYCILLFFTYVFYACVITYLNYTTLVKTKDEEKKDSKQRKISYFALYCGFWALGDASGQFAGGLIIERFGIRFPFVLEGCFYALVMVLIILHKPRILENDDENEKPQDPLPLSKLFEYLKNKIILAFILMVVIYKMCPSFALFYNVYQIEYLKLTSQDMGVLFMLDTLL
jgi:MFS family permease